MPLNNNLNVTANVACLVSHVDLWICTVHAHTNSKVLCLAKVFGFATDPYYDVVIQ